ncbi:unnamed protein product [Rotaria magnacalcarata]
MRRIIYWVSDKSMCMFNKFLPAILVSKEFGWQTCNNITGGVNALPCDDTLSLYCYSNSTCQCPSTMYWDINDQQCGTCSCPDLIQRKRINGTRLDTYAYDCNAPLVGFSGLCLCPTPTTWTGPKCTYSTGQTWTGSTCVAIG